MSILQENLISKNGTLKTKNIFGEKEPNIFFNSEIKSTNLPKFYFTNFIDGKKSPMVDFLKKERRKFLKQQVDFDNEYEIKSIDRKTEQKKINEILKTTLNKSSINVSLLLRLKSIDNPRVQFFFIDDNEGNYEVLFIDIYHLVLPAPDKSYHEKKANPKKTYKEHEKASYCLSNIFHK